MKRKKSAPVRHKPVASASPSALLKLGCVGLMAGSTVVLAADDEPRRLGTVSVSDTVIEDSYNRSETSSPRATAPLLDTPATVSVITQEVIRERAARTLYDVLGNTPGISFDAGENGFGSSSNNFTLRGFDASGSVFIDNARDSGSYTRDVFNVESVEVVKGAAADNGRGNAGGYVNLSTKQPRLSSFILADASYGFDSYDSKSRKRGTLDFNQQLSDSSALRVNVVMEDSGVPGRAVAETDVKGFAPSITFGLGGRLRTVLSWEYLDRNDVPDWGVPVASVRIKTYESLNPGLANPGVYNPLTAGAPRDGFYGLATDFDSSTSHGLLGRVEYDLTGNLTLSNQLRSTEVRRAARYTHPNNPGFTPATLSVPTATEFYRRENDSLSNLTNLSARFNTGGISHSLAAGLELTRERSTADRLAAANLAPGSTSLFNPDPYRVGAADFIVDQTARIRVDTQALYVYDTLTFSDRFQITGGVRGENYEVNLDSLTAAGLPQGAADDYSREKFSFGGRLGLVFKPVQDASVYASVGTSTQPQGSYLSNPDISRTGDNAFPGLAPGATKPVRSWNYEAGLKWDFHEGALSTTATVFRTDKRDVPVLGRNVAAGEPANAMLFQGYHNLVVQGVEVGIAGAINPNWQIFAGALFSESERNISAELDAARRAGNSGAGDYGAATSVDGDSLAFTPDFSANLWTTYRLPYGLMVGGGLRHVGSQYIGRPDDATRIISNTRYGKLPAYTVFNALVSWEIAERVNLRVNVDNIADKKYLATTNWNGAHGQLGASRSYLVSVGVDF